MVNIPNKTLGALLFFMAIFVTGYCFAAVTTSSNSTIQQAGKVIYTTGTITANQPNQPERTLQRGSLFYPGDTIKTGANTTAQINFTDGTLLVLRPKSTIRLDKYHYQSGSTKPGQKATAAKTTTGKPTNFVYSLSLVNGGLRTITGTIAKLVPANYNTVTPVATIGVRGTEFLASTNDVYVLKGVVAVTNNTGKKTTLLLGDNQKFRHALIENAAKAPKGLTKIPASMLQMQRELKITRPNQVLVLPVKGKPTPNAILQKKSSIVADEKKVAKKSKVVITKKQIKKSKVTVAKKQAIKKSKTPTKVKATITKKQKQVKQVKVKKVVKKTTVVKKHPVSEQYTQPAASGAVGKRHR